MTHIFGILLVAAGVLALLVAAIIIVVKVRENRRLDRVVAEANYGHGGMVVDPAFDIDFPGDAEGTRYFGPRELRADPTILERRVAELTRLRGASDDKVSFYKLRTEHYSHVRTMNLEKNAVTRGGMERTRVLRSAVLETLIRISAVAGMTGPALTAAR